MEKNQELQNKRNKSLAGGGVERLERQHKQGKLSARERIAVLLGRIKFPRNRWIRRAPCNSLWFG